MRNRWAITVGLLALVGGTATAQGPAPVVPDDVPPLVRPFDPPPLPNGLPVSQPLQATADPSAAPRILELPNALTAPPVPLRSMPASWTRTEFLLWWPKGQPLPPVAVVGRDAVPRLGAGGVAPFIGGSSLPSPDTGGGRFVLGWALSDARTHGFEVSYFFLGTTTQTANAFNGGRSPYLGRPFVNANTGAEDVSLVAGPGAAGQLAASTSGRLTGWEATLLRSLYDGPAVRLNALAGYRYFMLNEGLRVESRTVSVPGAGFAVADQLDAHNRFHGGQLGLRADVARGSFFAELDAKVGLGRTVQVVRVSGLTAFENGLSVPVGVYGQPSNSGRVSRSAFAVLPEAGLRIGWRLGEASRVILGYTVTYLSDAVRPGDQLDRVLDPTAGGFGDRPAPLFVRSDFWVQGLSLGLEWRY